MEIRVLKYFLAVVREQSITKAAEILHITQPTISRQLAQLEEETGVQLFKRGARQIVLTEEGMLLRRRASEIIELVEKTQNELLVQDELVEGNISIGCGELESMQNVAELIEKFKQSYPKVTFEIYTAEADLVRERMDQGLIDVGLLLEPVDIEKYDYIRLCQKEVWAALLPVSSPLAARLGITVADLLGQPIIMPRRTKVQGELASWFGDDFANLKVEFTSNFSTNASILVSRNLGIALILGGGRPFLDDSAVCIRPLMPELSATSVLAWKRHPPFTRAVTKFIEFARSELTEEREKI